MKFPKIFVTVMLMIPAIVFAAAETWTIPSTVLTDGTTVSGSFTYDAATNTLTNPNIVATGTINATYSFPGSMNWNGAALVMQSAAVATSSDNGFYLLTTGIGTAGSQYVSSTIGILPCTSIQPAGFCHNGGAIATASNVTLTKSVAAPAAIPTLSEWAMIFMASLMAMFGIRRMRRSK